MSHSLGPSFRTSRLSALAAFTLGSATFLTCYKAFASPIACDATPEEHVKLEAESSPKSWTVLSEQTDSLDCLVWGSNADGLLLPGGLPGVLKTPQLSPTLFHHALRSLALHEQYGACVDARGDLYQWGKGFSGNLSPPKLTLAGKDISDVALTKNKLFALSSSSGKVFVLASKEGKQGPTSNSSFFSSLIGKGSTNIDFLELRTNKPLTRGEKFTSISAGDEHLIALTSKGRLFGLPVTMKANSHGQLGFRKISINHSGSAEEQELNPVLTDDPYARTTSFRRISRQDSDFNRSTATNESSVAQVSEAVQDIDDSPIQFCTTLTEIPSLQNIRVTQAVAGSRSTYALVDGHVIAWGANENGQLGLGASVTLPYVTVPTEISYRSQNDIATPRCTSVYAAGDTAYFVVERKAMEQEIAVNEVLACGQGQFGSLGNGRYSTAQGKPTRIKAVSGLMEYSEKEKMLKPLPIQKIVASARGHAFLIFDTLERTGPGGVRGRDLVSWGCNRSCELGNGNRTNQAVPANLQEGDKMPFMLREKTCEVRDMCGKRWRGSATVQQVPVPGYGNTIVYWQIKQ